MRKIKKAINYLKNSIRFYAKNVFFGKDVSLEKAVSVYIDKKAKISFCGSAIIRQLTEIRAAGEADITFGKGCFINRGCMIIAHKRITIGTGVTIGPNVMIYDHDHDYRKAGGIISTPVEIENNVWVGAGAIILRGAIIREGAVIAAGSVVKGEVPPYSVYFDRRQPSIKQYGKIV